MVGTTAMATAEMLAFDIATKIPHATARAAALFVNVAGAAGVATAVEGTIVGEAIVGAMDDLQERELPTARRDKIAEALLVAVTRSPEWDRVGSGVGFLATEGRGNYAGNQGPDAFERAAPRDMTGNDNR